MTTYLDRMKDEYRELAERRRKLHAAIPELASRLDPEDVDLLRRQHVAMDEYCRVLALRIGRAARRETDKDMTPQLAPCPFCGSTDVALLKEATPYVACDNCGAKGPALEVEPVIAAEQWNQRAK